MTTERAAEIGANLARAEESLVAAGELLENGHWDFAASRAYYAAFYASTALVLSSRISTFGRASKARAMATRCFCPPERLTPRCPTIVS